MFDLAFTGAELEPDDEGLPRLRGRIVLGAYSERFLAPLALWTRDAYERQWREAAQRLLGSDASAGFFTVAFQFWWEAWREETTVFFQERLLLPGVLANLMDFTVAPYHLIEPRRTFSEDGVISEWQVSVAEVEEFASRAAIR